MYQEERRRERGDMARKQYLEKERDKTIKKVAELKKLLDKGVQRKEIIQRMGISLPYYKKLKKQI
ncbi:hypothetical protein AAV35_000490 [Salimicrobium jeotgali]|uniref:Uncharacterized protein n=1 Tax=Salimicrobium jeotgali TaxID=1230341 RepID=A0AAC8PPQ4_9BACI|nr:hypothetical protein [Salimicrobium jeotgali]AKG03406.1 hypothetical protein AAV35_000490 [Salimicrobium jeotgali]MBM7697653.1 hypothetical protein [Salimicrobium jeotgali]